MSDTNNNRINPEVITPAYFERKLKKDAGLDAEAIKKLSDIVMAPGKTSMDFFEVFTKVKETIETDTHYNAEQKKSALKDALLFIKDDIYKNKFSVNTGKSADMSAKAAEVTSEAKSNLNARLTAEKAKITASNAEIVRKRGEHAAMLTKIAEKTNQNAVDEAEWQRLAARIGEIAGEKTGLDQQKTKEHVKHTEAEEKVNELQNQITPLESEKSDLESQNAAIDTGNSPRFREKVEKKAHELWVARGETPHGGDRNDWYEAERQVKEEEKRANNDRIAQIDQEIARLKNDQEPFRAEFTRSTDAEQAIDAQIQTIEQEKTDLVAQAQAISDKIGGFATSDEETKLRQLESEIAGIEAQITESQKAQAAIEQYLHDPSFANLVTVAEYLPDELRDKIRLLNVLRQVARNEQEDSDGRWAHVRQANGKFFWVKGDNTPDSNRGFEGDAILGDEDESGLYRTNIPVELTNEEKAKFLAWEARTKAAEAKAKADFDNILQKIIDHGFDQKKDMLAQRDDFWNDLSDDERKAFAKMEKADNDDQKCKRNLLSYINKVTGKPARLKFREEEISESDKKKLLDNLDIVEDILESVGKEMGESDIYKVAEKLEKIIMSGGGETNEEKLIYLKYLNFRNAKGHGMQDSDVMMVHFIEYILQQKQNGQTANLEHVFGKGWKKKEPLWKTDMSDEAREAFAKDLMTYKEVMQFLKTKEDYKNMPASEIRKLLKEICQNHESYDLSKPINKDATNGDSAAVRLAKLLNNEFKQLGDITPYIYKALIYFEETPVKIRKIDLIEVETGDHDGHGDHEHHEYVDKDLDIAREHYADRRRSLGKFMEWKGAPDDRVAAAREDYAKNVRGMIVHKVTDPAFHPNVHAARDNAEFRRQAAQAIVQELLDERKKLLQQEIKLQNESHWEKFKTMWRKHPLLRMSTGVGLTTAAFFTGSGAIWSMAAAFRALSGMIAWEGGWEGMRNRGWWPAGITRNKNQAKVDAMDPGEIMYRLAGHTTMGTSMRPGYGAMPAADAPVSDFYGTPQRVPAMTPGAAGRGETAERLWESNQAYLMKVAEDSIQTTQNAGGNRADAIKNAVDKVLYGKLEHETNGVLAEIHFMKKVEDRERYIRKNNMLKKATGLLFGFTIAGLARWYHGPEQHAAGTTPPEPGATPPPVDQGTPPIIPHPQTPPIEHGPPAPSPVTPPGPIAPPAPPPGPVGPIAPPPPAPVGPIAPQVPPVQTVIPEIHDFGPSEAHAAILKIPYATDVDPDVGILQSFRYKLGMTGNEWQNFMGKVGGENGLRRMLSGANTGLDSHHKVIKDGAGHILKGWNVVKKGQEIAVPPQVMQALGDSVKGRISMDDIVKKLGENWK